MHCARLLLLHDESQSGNTETEKLSIKENCPTIIVGSWTLFRKEWTWLTWRSNSNRRTLSTRSVGSRERFSPEMISFAAITFALNKDWLKEVKELFPVFSLFLYFVIALFWRSYYAIMKCVIVQYFQLRSLCIRFGASTFSGPLKSFSFKNALRFLFHW